MLAYFDLGTANTGLTSVGSVVTAKPWTRNFGGALNGADSIDGNVDANGTGRVQVPQGRRRICGEASRTFWEAIYGVS
jgi:hypothetical protein